MEQYFLLDLNMLWYSNDSNCGDTAMLLSSIITLSLLNTQFFRFFCFHAVFAVRTVDTTSPYDLLVKSVQILGVKSPFLVRDNLAPFWRDGDDVIEISFHQTT